MPEEARVVIDPLVDLQEFVGRKGLDVRQLVAGGLVERGPHQRVDRQEVVVKVVAGEHALDLRRLHRRPALGRKYLQWRLVL